MKFHLSNNTLSSGSYYFAVEVGSKPETFESYMKRVFAGVGLRSPYHIQAFDKFMGQAYFNYMLSNAKGNAAVADAVLTPKGKTIKITVAVSASIVEKLRRFGINLLVSKKGIFTFDNDAPTYQLNVKKYQNFREAPSTPISQWTTVQKLDSVIRRAALLLPESVGNQLLALLEPWALAAMGVVLIIWIGGHFFIASQIADAALLVVGGIFLGMAAFQAGGHLANFAIKCVDGRTEKHLDESAQHLAEAISLIGVQVVMTLLLAKLPNAKLFQEPKIKMSQLEPSIPFTMKTVGEPPINPGKIFYDPPITPTKSQYPSGKSAGLTKQWGEIELLVTKHIDDVDATVVHELVHQILTPKLQIFPKIRQYRAVLKNQGYLRSYLLRYLEEALAETMSQLLIRGINWRNFMAGVKFPVGQAGEGCYVTKAAMATEAKGILIGPINVGGMTFNVYYIGSKQKK